MAEVSAVDSRRERASEETKKYYILYFDTNTTQRQFILYYITDNNNIFLSQSSFFLLLLYSFGVISAFLRRQVFTCVWTVKKPSCSALVPVVAHCPTLRPTLPTLVWRTDDSFLLSCSLTSCSLFLPLNGGWKASHHIHHGLWEGGRTQSSLFLTVLPLHTFYLVYVYYPNRVLQAARWPIYSRFFFFLYCSEYISSLDRTFNPCHCRVKRELFQLPLWYYTAFII